MVEGIYTAGLWAAAADGDIHCLNVIAEEIDYKDEGIAKVLQNFRFLEGKCVLNAAVTGNEAGKMDMIAYLVEKLKLDVNHPDEDGETPLHVAAEDGDVVTAAYLLDHGAHIDASMNQGYTPLHLAAKKGQRKMMRFLISRGANVEAQSLAGTPLYSAAALGVTDSVEFLLENLANPNAMFDHTLPPLIAAVYSKSVDCVRMMLKGGADPNISLGGLSPLVEAIFDGETDMILSLLKAGADPNAPNFYGLAPIEIAAKRGNKKGVEALLPATTPIDDIPDWSCDGIFNHINSDFFRIKWKLKTEEYPVEAKANADAAVGEKQYMRAVHWYGKAIEFKQNDHILYSNRSYCWVRLNEGEGALDDALKCIELKGDWPKAYYRAGVAWRVLKRYDISLRAFNTARELDPRNKDILKAYWEAMDLRDEELVASNLGLEFPDDDEV